MRNAAYWQQRALLLKEALEAIGEDFILDLDREYKAASAAVQRDLRAWYQRFADNNGITLAQARRWLTTGELEEFRWTVEDYIKAGESLDPKWAKALENASARVHISRLEALQVQLQQTVEVLYGNQLDGLDRLLSRVYSEGYYHTLFDLQQGLGMGWNMERLSPEAIREVLSKPWTADGRTFSERIWTNRDQLVRQVQTTVTQGLMRGLSTREMGSGLQKAMGSSRYAAMRVVNTETAYFSVRAQERGLRDIGVEQYQILETLDTHTCGTCGPMDGMVLPMSQFEAGVTAPPFHPNCRGCVSPYIEDLDGTRIARDAEGNTIDVPGDMTYQEWRKKFIERVETPSKSGIIEQKETYGGDGTVHSIGRIDVEKYRVVSGSIRTDEVIITEERIEHIKQRHPSNFEKYSQFISEMLASPDYILEANKPNTAFILKEFESENERFQLILRLAVEGDEPGYKNSVITFLKVEEKRYRRYLRTKKILYKSK